MRFIHFGLCVFLLMAAHVHGAEAGWKAGVARSIITPNHPIWLAGYGKRDKPAEGKLTELWIKALAIEDAEGRQAVILTSDTLGIPQSIHRNVCAGLKQRFHLEPHQIL